MKTTQAAHDSKFYLVGGGIASLAAAAFLIRDGDVRGSQIKILEESATLGGSLDASGTSDTGYRMRGGRMIKSKYLCTFDLFRSIPTVDDRMTVTDEIFEWNRTMKTHSRSRLFRHGKSVDAPALGLSEQDILTIERLEPWHSAVEFKRYLVRFTHMVSGFNTLTGIMRTRYNQFDSLVLPLERWLKERGVRFHFDTRVLDLALVHDSTGYAVEQIFYETNGASRIIDLATTDRVMVTLGSMTEASTFGTMEAAPMLRDKSDAGSWQLW